MDFRSTKDGELAPPGKANEITFQLGKTKTDQFAFRESKTLRSTGKTHICPVQALWSAGSMLRKQAAKGVGLPPSRFVSHSLRIGGATALFQATGEIELVERMGRWSSSADRGDTIPKVSQKMAGVPSTVHYT